MKRDPVTLDASGRVLDPPEIEREASPLPWYVADDPRELPARFVDHAESQARASLGEIIDVAERGIAWAVVGGIAYVVAQQFMRRR